MSDKHAAPWWQQHTNAAVATLLCIFAACFLMAFLTLQCVHTVIVHTDRGHDAKFPDTFVALDPCYCSSLFNTEMSLCGCSLLTQVPAMAAEDTTASSTTVQPAVASASQPESDSWLPFTDNDWQLQLPTSYQYKETPMPQRGRQVQLSSQ